MKEDGSITGLLNTTQDTAFTSGSPYTAICWKFGGYSGPGLLSTSWFPRAAPAPASARLQGPWCS